MPRKLRVFITKEEFLSKVIRDPKKRQGDGQYFTGGECNWGGNHVLSEDIEIINKFFNDVFVALNVKKPSKCKNEAEFSQ
jgi:hypothetical protein